VPFAKAHTRNSVTPRCGCAFAIERRPDLIPTAVPSRADEGGGTDAGRVNRRIFILAHYRQSPVFLSKADVLIDSSVR
jgi:hypothetical protein